MLGAKRSGRVFAAHGPLATSHPLGASVSRLGAHRGRLGVEGRGSRSKDQPGPPASGALCAASFLGRSSPTKIGREKVGTLILTSAGGASQNIPQVPGGFRPFFPSFFGKGFDSFNNQPKRMPIPFFPWKSAGHLRFHLGPPVLTMAHFFTCGE